MAMGTPRVGDGAPLVITPAGIITSGAPSPTLGVPIAMGYLPPAQSSVGTMVEVTVRATQAEADVVQLPFYKRS